MSNKEIFWFVCEGTVTQYSGQESDGYCVRPVVGGCAVEGDEISSGPVATQGRGLRRQSYPDDLLTGDCERTRAK